MVFFSLLVKLLSISLIVFPLYLVTILSKPSTAPLKLPPKVVPRPSDNQYSSGATSSPSISLKKVSLILKLPPKAALLLIPFQPFAVTPNGIICIRPAAMASA